jgi:hypothetical protein
MEDNKLIGNFMDIRNTGLSVYKESAYKYHESWDWLMPVVQECLTKGEDEHEWDAIYNAVGTIDMENIYQAVVEFIKTYNDEK